MDKILLSHGAGGREMVELIERVFLEGYGDQPAPGDDSATLTVPSGRLAFTTDAFVVDPLFFPGGDIGRLAVAGTVNDLLTAAAKPLALAISFIIEEGLEVAVLASIARSIRQTADEAGVRIVTGDTKVVPRGSADKVFITTTGLGEVLRPGVSGAAVRPGDKIILTGGVGEHGMAVMLAREQLVDAGNIVSDVAPLTDIVLNLMQAGRSLHAMRDPTRGGLAAALNEIARQSAVALEIHEDCIPVQPGVAAAAEALGLDVLTVANEGKMLILVAAGDADNALDIVRRSRYGGQARIIGEALPGPAGRVTVRTAFGTSRFLDFPSGELLPRIC